jgi:hypothetical protein
VRAADGEDKQRRYHHVPPEDDVSHNKPFLGSLMRSLQSSLLWQSMHPCVGATFTIVEQTSAQV